MSIFILKLIAVFFMIVDHVKYAFPACFNQFTLYFGRVAFPIFAFCTVQGYIHTHNLKKYLIRLFIAGIITEIPYLLFNSLPLLQRDNLNIMFTLLLGLIALSLYDSYDNKIKKIFSVFVICVIAEITKVDYGLYGILIMLSFYIFKDNKFKTLILSCSVVFAKYIYRLIKYRQNLNYLSFENDTLMQYILKNCLCSLIPLFIILLYNGKKGKSFKWFFYIIYPLQFFLLWILSPYVTNFIN